MISRHRLRNIGWVLTLIAVLMFVPLDTAVARAWNLSFYQDKFATATLQSLNGIEYERLCPAHFNPVRLVANIDLKEFGSLHVETDAAEHLLSTKEDSARAKREIALNLQLNVIGCSFRHHFLPQEGQLTITGGLGIGNLQETKFSFLSGNRRNSLEIRYTANLAGRDKTVPQPSYLGCCSTLTTWHNGRRVQGTLFFRPREDWIPIESARLDKEAVHLDFWPPRLFILAPDELN